MLPRLAAVKFLRLGEASRPKHGWRGSVPANPDTMYFEALCPESAIGASSEVSITISRPIPQLRWEAMCVQFVWW